MLKAGPRAAALVELWWRICRAGSIRSCSGGKCGAQRAVCVAQELFSFLRGCCNLEVGPCSVREFDWKLSNGAGQPTPFKSQRKQIIFWIRDRDYVPHPIALCSSVGPDPRSCAMHCRMWIKTYATLAWLKLGSNRWTLKFSGAWNHLRSTVPPLEQTSSIQKSREGKSLPIGLHQWFTRNCESLVHGTAPRSHSRKVRQKVVVCTVRSRGTPEGFHCLTSERGRGDRTFAGRAVEMFYGYGAAQRLRM